MKVVESLNTRALLLTGSETITSGDVRWLLTRTKRMSESDADEVANLLFDSLVEIIELQGEDEDAVAA